jgi:hypothetical protein
MPQATRKAGLYYRWVRHASGRGTFADVGILEDGTLHNPNGYPEAEVRAGVEAAIARRKERRKKAAAKAVVTRARRLARRKGQIADQIRQGHGVGPRDTCACCLKALQDALSMERGIGPECWQQILQLIDTRGPDPAL